EHFRLARRSYGQISKLRSLAFEAVESARRSKRQIFASTWIAREHFQWARRSDGRISKFDRRPSKLFESARVSERQIFATTAMLCMRSVSVTASAAKLR